VSLGIVQAFKAVFWSFFGVRKHAHYQSDFTKLKIQHVIAAGVVSVLLFVLAIYALVQFVTR
jgi:hypothetical protein